MSMSEEDFHLDIGAIIVATGWRPFDAANLENLSYGELPNIVTNVMLERLAAPGGPTGGKIVRPSDGEEPVNAAFVQCAGSRDENHLPYCSGVCCMASLKQARYLREQNEEAKITIFYIDIRTIGRLENFYHDLLEDENITFIKGKVAGISPGEGDNLILEVEDTIAGEKPSAEFDMVILATGIVPNTADTPIPVELEYDEFGFLDGGTGVAGIYAAGCVRHPCDVSTTTREATAAALKAIQDLNR
jgi:quinone-modifying oxidoreductase subunit QmoA